MENSPSKSPQAKNSGNISSSSRGEEERKERAVGTGGEGSRVHPPSPAPTVQAGPSSGRPKKKQDVGAEAGKGKEAEKGKEAAATVVVVLGEEKGKKKKSGTGALANLPERARTCSICRREFATARALFGHMRSHPEREWRGAHPPPVSATTRQEAEVERDQEERERQEAERIRQAEELARSLFNIGQNILKSTRHNEIKEGDQVSSGAGGSSSAAIVTAEAGEGVQAETPKRMGKEWVVEASGSVRGRPPMSSSSSGDTAEGKKKNKKKKKKKKMMMTAGAHDLADEEDRRKQIHLGLDLNKEAPVDEEDDHHHEEKDMSEASK